MPLLTRLYGPDDFGLMAVFTALVLMITPVLTLNYVLALPLPRRDGTAMNLMALSLLLLLALGGVMSLLLWAFGATLLRLLSMEALAPWWWLIVLGSLGGAVYELLSYWATRRRSYMVIARTSVTQQISGNLVKLGLGAIDFGTGGLLIGEVVAKSGGSLSLARAFWAEFGQAWRHVRLRRIRQLAGRYMSFPVYRVPSQFLLIFAQQFPLIGVAYLYEPSVAGQFSLALTTLALPLGLIGSSMGKALFAEASSLGMANRFQIYTMAKQVQIRLFLVSLLPALLLFLLGPELFSLAFGSEWRQAGTFAAILAVFTIFQFTSSPIIQLLSILPDQSTFLAISIGRTFAIIALFGVARYLKQDAHSLIAWYSLVMSIFYVLVSHVAMSKIKRERY